MAAAPSTRGGRTMTSLATEETMSINGDEIHLG